MRMEFYIVQAKLRGRRMRLNVSLAVVFVVVLTLIDSL